jgi:hypothetical protein
VGTAQRTAVLRLSHAYSCLARRQALSCAAIFLLTIGLRAALLPRLGVPNPIIHDEFSYLLSADTYANGRLANPPHPFWQHFETFQELQQPTYASKYQPLQGLALALGQKVFDQPWIGVVLTSALMCAAVCWMLQSWIAPEWALLGALLFTFRIGVLSYWMNSFEGGAIPAIGGALVFGAVGRIWRGEYFHAATCLTIWALGLAVLMHSRPYDAVVAGVVSAAGLPWLLRKSGTSLTVSALTPSAAWPALAVLAASTAAVAYVDYRVTGNPLTLPYQAHDRQYVTASPFLLAPLSPEPVYRHAVMRDFYTGWSVETWRESREQPLIQLLGRAYILIGFFFGSWPVTVLLLLSPLAFKTVAPETMGERAGVVFTAAGFASIAPLAGVFPHYAAAFAGIFYLRYMQSLARVASWRRPFGPAIAAAVVALFIFSGRDEFSSTLADRSGHFGEQRASMQSSLAAMPGRQLVLVRYAPGHNTQNEWVFNAANIDNSKVVWAREMSPEQDGPFLQYFHDRQVWLAEPDKTPPSLTPYPAADADKEARR